MKFEINQLAYYPTSIRGQIIIEYFVIDSITQSKDGEITYSGYRDQYSLERDSEIESKLFSSREDVIQNLLGQLHDLMAAETT